MKVGVIGAGTMGSGIAQVFAQAGCDVLLCDINLEFAERGKTKIAAALAKRVEKGKMEKTEADAICSRVKASLKNACGDCDLIVEAAVENLEIKKQTFAELHKICKPECLFASNTSSLSLTEISKGLGRPVTGMHFFNPAPVMKLIEVVVAEGTPEAVYEQIMKIGESLGKTPVLVKDSAGFVVNRILIPMINEGIAIYAEGVCSAEGVDSAMHLGANMPLGPLALGDMIGLDVCLAIMEILQDAFGDKYAPHPLLKEMVASGKLGKKSGEGFYKY